jgi:hypothetical protein
VRRAHQNTYPNRSYSTSGDTSWKKYNRYEAFMSTNNISDSNEIVLSCVDPLTKFVKDLVNEPKSKAEIHVVITLGNHEFFKPHATSLLYKNLHDLNPERVHFVSNMIPKKPERTVYNDPSQNLTEPKSGWVDYLKPSVQIGDVRFVGYCTTEVINGQNDSNYQYAVRENPFVDIEQGNISFQSTKHQENFIKSLIPTTITSPGQASLRSYNPHDGILVVLCHSHLSELNFLANNPEFEKYQSRLIIGGHKHDNNGYMTIGKQQKGRQVEIFPLPLAYSAVVAEYLPYSNKPSNNSGEVEWSYLTKDNTTGDIVFIKANEPLPSTNDAIYISVEEKDPASQSGYSKKLRFHEDPLKQTLSPPWIAFFPRT